MPSALKYSAAAVDDIRFSAILFYINAHKASREDHALLETVMRAMVRGITINYII